MKDDGVYLRHVLRRIARIEEYTAVGREGFFSSPLIQDGVIRTLQTLAESAQRLSESIKESYPEVDWKGLAGFRNVLVHDYLGVDQSGEDYLFASRQFVFGEFPQAVRRKILALQRAS